MKPDTPWWTEFDYLVQNDFEYLVSRRIEIKRLQEELEGLNMEMVAFLDSAGVKSVLAGDEQGTYLITRTGGGASLRLSEEMLRHHGVADWIIKRSKVPTNPSRPSISVTKMKEQE